MERELEGLGIGRWTKPRGGYFISFDSLEGVCKGYCGQMQEGRSGYDICRGNLSIWKRSPGQQHPHCTHLSHIGGFDNGCGAVCTLRKALLCGKAFKKQWHNWRSDTFKGKNDSSVKIRTLSDNDRERRIASRCARSLPHCPGYADSRRSGTDLRAGTI